MSSSGGEKKSRGGAIKSIMKRIPKYDLFGANPSFLIQGEDTNKTSYGCFLSTFLIFVMMAVSVFYIVRFAIKGENNVAQAISIEEGIPSHQIGKSNSFFFSIMFRDGERLRNFTNIDLRLIQVMKDRKNASRNTSVRGADSGVKGFKGPNWSSNVFNPYSRSSSSKALNEKILTYKTILPKLNKRS